MPSACRSPLRWRWPRWSAPLWIDLPVAAVMQQLVQRRRQGIDADDPVLRAGRRDHGRGRHGAAAGGFRRRHRRLHPYSRRPVAGQYSRDHDHERHLRLVGGRHLRDRLGDDPADGREGLSARVCHQRHHQRLAAGHRRAAQPQRGDLLAGDRRRRLHHQPVSGRGISGPAAGLFADAAVPVLCLSRQASEGRAGADPAGRQNAGRRGVGYRDAGDRARRHPHRRLHADRGRRGGLRVGVLRHHVHLPRLQMVGTAACWPTGPCKPSPWC